MDMCKDVSLAGSFHHLRWSPSLPEGGYATRRGGCFVLMSVVTLSPYGASAVKNIVALLGQGSTLVLLVVFSSPRHPFIAI